jgi:archaeal flagellin FlaB
MKIFRQLLKDQKGMTGLETALILVAFVTIAAVFGYAVLSAGLFTAERDKDSIYSGLQGAKSNMELCGSVIALGDNNTSPASISKIKFTVRNAIAGNPIDMTECNGSSGASNKCVISLITGDTYLNNVKWTKTAVGKDDGDNLLETGEQFEITLDTSDLGTGLSLASDITANDSFSIQVKPALGSTITIKRTVPPCIAKVMDLDSGASFGAGP